MLYIIFGSYVAGMVGVVIGFGLRALATKKDWALRNSKLEAYLVVISVPLLVFGVPLILILGFDWILASEERTAWVDERMTPGTFFIIWHLIGAIFSLILGMPLGWIIGPDKGTKVPRGNPFEGGGGFGEAEPSSDGQASGPSEGLNFTGGKGPGAPG
jgi:hypothetical protein